MKNHFIASKSITPLRADLIAVACICGMATSACSIVRVEDNGHVLSHSIHFLTKPTLPRPQHGLAVYQTTAIGAFKGGSMLGVGAAMEFAAYPANANACGTIMLVESLPSVPPPWLLEIQRLSPNSLCVAEFSHKEKIHDP